MAKMKRLITASVVTAVSLLAEVKWDSLAVAARAVDNLEHHGHFRSHSLFIVA